MGRWKERHQQFTSTLELVTLGLWVLQTIHQGHPAQITSPLQTIIFFERQWSRLTQTIEVVITVVLTKQGAYSSTFFLTTKKAGECRPILNLKLLRQTMAIQDGVTGRSSLRTDMGVVCSIHRLRRCLHILIYYSYRVSLPTIHGIHSVSSILPGSDASNIKHWQE